MIRPIFSGSITISAPRTSQAKLYAHASPTTNCYSPRARARDGRDRAATNGDGHQPSPVSTSWRGESESPAPPGSRLAALVIGRRR